MILDTSAVIAVVFREKRHKQLEEALADADSLAISAPTLLETAMVATGAFDQRGQELVIQFLADRGVKVIPFDSRHCRTAANAFSRYGKGRHPAGLNYGDCIAYAAASVAGEPLLFVGNDFARTDIAPA